MSVSSWDPSAEQAVKDFRIDMAQLKHFIDLSKRDELDQLPQTLSQRDQQTQARLMQQAKESWFEACEALNDDEIMHLMRFFTKAECLPGWEAGDNSPVIWLGKILKKRGKGISKELVLWIKANSNNRFLPHGALV